MLQLSKSQLRRAVTMRNWILAGMLIAVAPAVRAEDPAEPRLPPTGGVLSTLNILNTLPTHKPISRCSWTKLWQGAQGARPMPRHRGLRPGLEPPGDRDSSSRFWYLSNSRVCLLAGS